MATSSVANGSRDVMAMTRRRRPSRRHRVDEPTDARDLDPDLVATREREVAGRHDARPRHEKDAVRKAVITEEIGDEVDGPPLELRERRLARERDDAAAR